MSLDHPFADLVPILTALKRMGGFPFYIIGNTIIIVISKANSNHRVTEPAISINQKGTRSGKFTASSIRAKGVLR